MNFILYALDFLVTNQTSFFIILHNLSKNEYFFGIVYFILICNLILQKRNYIYKKYIKTYLTKVFNFLNNIVYKYIFGKNILNENFMNEASSDIDKYKMSEIE